MTIKKTPRRILAQPYDYSVQDIVDKVINGDIDISPNYQRNYVWAANDEIENKCSRLIESLLLNIPIPVIYFAEQAETLKYEVIDGQQRLNTFCRFLSDDFKLKDLSIRDDVNGKFFSELEQKDRDEIRKRSIRAIVILNESDAEIKYEVFERLNLGSIQLTPQEIRNNTLRGSFNDLLKELALNKLFKSMLKLRLKNDQENMAYEELILRFFAYHEGGYKRVSNLSYFLTSFMELNKDADPMKINEYRNIFESTLELVNKFISDKAFSNFSKKTGRWATKSNRALYDAEMLAFASFLNKKILITADDFIAELELLMCNDEFKKSTHAQAGGRMIEYRVSKIKDIIAGK